MIKSKGFAAQSATSSLAPFSFDRRDVGKRDVQIEILYCGLVTLTYIQLAMNGRIPRTHVFRATKSLGGS